MNDLLIDSNKNFTIQDLFLNVGAFIDNCTENKDLDTIIEHINGLKRVHERSGVALAWIWYKTKAVWELFDVGDNFFDTMAGRTGYNVEVVRRYVRVAEMLDNAPKEVIGQLSEKGIKDLIPIANANSAYDFTDENWSDLAQSSPEDIPEYIRSEIRHADPRSNLISLYVDRMGTIWAYSKQDDRKFVGSLELENAEEDETIKKAVMRIINNAHIRQD